MPIPKNEIALRSEEVQDILTAVPQWMIRWGNTLVLALIIGLLSLSYFIKYPDLLNAEALITTLLPPQKEYAKVTGKIDTFLVQDQQMVEAKMPLAIIENTADFQQVFLLKNIIDTLSLSAGLFAFPFEQLPVLSLGDIEADFALFENSYDQYLLNKQLQPFSKENQANRNTLGELQKQLQNLQWQQSIHEEELKLQKKELERSKQLLAEGLIATQDYDAKQLKDLQAERDLKNRNLSISQIQESINRNQFSSRQININQTIEEKLLLRTVLQSFNRLKRAIKNWELQYVLSAELAGQVALLDFGINKQRVQKGDLVFTIIPRGNTEYLAKLKTPAFNAGKVKIGQTVNIRLDNYPDTEFGTINGTIKKIALTSDKEGQYNVEVALSTPLITSYQKEIDFQQEMQGSAEIITEDLRLIERFFYQFRAVF